MDKQTVVQHIMKYYSSIKRNYLYTIWMNLKNTVLNKRSQTQKSTYGMISLI